MDVKCRELQMHGIKINEKNEMGWECSVNGGEWRCIQCFDGEN